MSGAVQIGPFTLPWQLLLILGAIAVSSLVGQHLARKSGIDVEPQLFWLLLVAVVVARLAFVVQFLDAYRASPLGIFNIRDGGWRALPGLVAAWAYAIFLGLRHRPLRVPVWSALASATLIWAVGVVGLSTLGPKGTPLPAITLMNLKGAPVSLRQFEGEPTVVNLWATWCPPCRREMPVLAQAQRDYPDVHFVFLNQGESADKVVNFLAREKLVLRNVLLDVQGETPHQFGQRALPTTLFFDARGRLVDTRIGEVSRATLAERLQTLQAAGSSR